jgi:hypothetical protein
VRDVVGSPRARKEWPSAGPRCGLVLTVRRLLPPLLCCAALAAIGWRVVQRPTQRAEEQRIASVWETHDDAGRAQVLAQVEAYEREHGANVDRAFLTQAYLRCRRIDLAVQARWPGTEAAPSAEEVRAWAALALRTLGWDDAQQRRPSRFTAPVTVTLLDGGDDVTRERLRERFAEEPIEQLYAFMRQSTWERSKATRSALAATCRGRAAGDAPGGTWDVAAALMEPRSPTAPGTPADLGLLRAFVEGPARVQFKARWILACRSLGESADPGSVAVLLRLGEGLAESSDPMDRHDRGVLLLAQVFAGRWEQEVVLRAILLEGFPELRSLVGLAIGILAERATAGDARAQDWLKRAWEGPAVEDTILRGVMASAVLGQPFGSAPAWAEDLAADLERPKTAPALQVHALAYRLRQGKEAARAALLAWLVRNAGEGVLTGVDPEHGSIPVLTALRALYLAP